MNFIGHFKKGIASENPTFRLVLGMCPTLAVTTSVINGIGMALATTFVLLFSNILVSMIGKYTPDKIRIPVYIIVIASFTTIADLLIAAFVPDLHKALGIFIPLIVVNCIIFARAEAFACKNNISSSIADALGMGIGFTLALALISSIREILGTGSIFGIKILGSYSPALIMILPPGAFLTLGTLIAIINYLQQKRIYTCKA